MRDKEEIERSDAAWVEIEQRALLGDRRSALFVVGALRRHRQSARELLDKRYRDGFIDGVCSSTFEIEIEEIERDALAENE